MSLPAPGWLDQTAQMRCLVAVSGCVVSFGLTAPPSVAAATAVTRLEWDAPALCPDLNAVSKRLAVLRGDGPLDYRALGTVRGVIRREGQGWQLTLELFDGGERKSRLIAADDCEDLADAAAVALALALDAEGVQAQTALAAAPGAEEASVEDVPPEAAQRSASVKRVLGHALLDTAALPGPAFGVGVELRADLSWLTLGAYGAWLPAQEEYVRSARFVDFGLWFAGLRACASLFRSRLEAAACAGVDAGALHAEGSGLVSSRRVTDLWLAPNAALELGIPLWQELDVSARGELAFPLVRRPYVINEGEGIHRPPVLDPRLWLGLAWTFE
jgi:hypothetical protein